MKLSVLRSLVLGLTFAFLTVAAGCGSGDKVAGTVTYKGQPVAGTSVAYLASDGSTVGQGVTDSAGRYKLANPQGKDAISPGTYSVVVTKTAGIEGDENKMNPAGGGDMKDMKAMMMKGKSLAKSVLPPQFGGKESPLKKTVPSGDYNLDLGS